mgnify:FL=1
MNKIKLNMKGLLFVIALVGFFGFSNVNAQCAKTGSACCAKKGDATSMVSAEDMSKAAKMDKTITSKKEKDGTITYQRKTKDATGKKVYADVTYDVASAKFVNSAPEAGKACAGEVKGKACAGEASKGACCAKKGTASASVPAPTPAKASSM